MSAEKKSRSARLELFPCAALFNRDWNNFLKDDDLQDPCVKNLNPAEKEIAHTLGPQNFTRICGGHDFMGTFGADYVYILIFSEKIVFRPRKYPYLLCKVSENPALIRWPKILIRRPKAMKKLTFSLAAIFFPALTVPVNTSVEVLRYLFFL